jgi:SAM-dependent methyltransferase
MCQSKLVSNSEERGKVDQNYFSGNLLIRCLLNRFLSRVADILNRIQAASRLGLDVGCGEGHLISYLHKREIIGDLVAVDLNTEKIRFAKNRLPAFKYFTADINKLTFKQDTFDYVLANEIFEHLPEPIGAIQELRRVLKKGAYLVISVPHEPFFHWGNLIQGKYWNRMGRTPAHVNFWNRKQFRKLLSGYAEIEEEYCFSTFPWLLYRCAMK